MLISSTHPMIIQILFNYVHNHIGIFHVYYINKNLNKTKIRLY
jgi:hypothetical protein